MDVNSRRVRASVVSVLTPWPAARGACERIATSASAE